MSVGEKIFDKLCYRVVGVHASHSRHNIVINRYARDLLLTQAVSTHSNLMTSGIILKQPWLDSSSFIALPLQNKAPTEATAVAIS
jgi:hypothetical protein